MLSLGSEGRKKNHCKYAWHQLSGEPNSCLHLDFISSFFFLLVFPPFCFFDLSDK